MVYQAHRDIGPRSPQRKASLLTSTLHIVLDTNVVLDWLVFRDPGVLHIIYALDQGRVRIVTNGPCEEELERVLGYVALSLDEASRRAIMAVYRQAVTRHPLHATGVSLPQCSDPDDQKFIELAHHAGARYLITKDKALLKLARARYSLRGFAIVPPKGFPALTDSTD
jgi:uncharacterized protein